MRIHGLSRRRAVASVEMAFLSLPLFILLFGVLEIGRVIQVQQIVSNATREGGRQASTGKYTISEVETAISEYLTNAGLPITDSTNTPNVTITVANTTTGGEVYGAAAQNELTISVAYPYANVKYLASNWFLAANANINTLMSWRTVTDVPVTVPTTIPSAPLP